ncbi:putative reverse transcriptase domain-containing protein [Tanacetum coccineum]
MANLPPPNNDPNIPEDEHAPAPEHAPIAPNPAPIQLNDYLANDEADPEEELEEEEEPIPKQAPAGFAPQWIGGHDPNNNNGWIKEDDEDEVEAEEDGEEEMGDEEDKEMDVEDNDGKNDDAEVYNPYEEADPLNRPPPSPKIAEREIMNTPVTRSTLQPIPPVWQFTGTFYVGKGSSATVFNPALCKVYSPGPMVNDPNTLYSRVKTLTKQTWDRFRVESLSFERGRRNEMLRIRLRAAEEKAEYNHMEAEYYKNHWARVLWYYNDLSGWGYRLRNQLPLKRRYRETTYDPSTNPTSRPQRVDPYVMVRDNVVRADAAGDRGGESVDTTTLVKYAGEENGDEGDDAAAAKDSQPSETVPPKRRFQTNPQPPLTQDIVNQLVRDGIEAAIRAERERVREEENRAGGPDGGLAAAPVATLGIKVANVKSWTKVKHMMIDEFCPTKEVQRLEDELRHLKLRDMNIAAYTERFNELALLYPDVVPNEKKKVELYIKGFPEIIKGETTSSRPTMLNEAVHMAHTLMEQKIQAKNERIAEGNKRRWENNNQGGNNNRNNNDNRNNCGNYHDNNHHNQYN